MCANVSLENECNIPGVLERQSQQNYHFSLSLSSASAAADSFSYYFESIRYLNSNIFISFF